MTTHKLTISEDGEQKTCFTVAANVGAAMDKVRLYFKNQDKQVVVEQCVPKPAILIVESFMETHSSVPLVNGEIVELDNLGI